MKSKILHPGGFEFAVWKTVALIFICAVCSAQSMPDVTGGTQGWRYATQEDADYWNNVSLGDVLMFGVIDPDTGLRYIPQNAKNGPINIEGGNKIHIWTGDYAMIRIEVVGPNGNGSFLETNSSEQNPVIITNLGGQVRFGGLVKYNLGNMNIQYFKHVFVTGEYDQALGTGDAGYMGLDGDLTARGWIDQFGIMGDRKYSTLQQNATTGAGLGLTINHFLSAKVRGAAVVRGFFTGFSIKSDDTTMSHHSTIDIQKCLSGWHTNEGFYVGSTQDADSYPDNKVIFKNNVVLFTGGDGLQLDKLSAGTEIRNNFLYKSSCFYQYPHQTGFTHDHTMQMSFVEGNVRAEDNILYGGSAGNLMNIFAIIAKKKATVQPSEIILRNNLFGPSRARFGYVHPSSTADPNAYVTFRIEDNIIDSMNVVCSNDVETPIRQFTEWITFANQTNPFYLTNNTFPAGDKDLYNSEATNVIESGTTLGPAPTLLLHSNFGFDPEDILRFRGVWLTGQYGATADSEGDITYNAGDMIFLVRENKTRYYRCIQTHSVAMDPATQTAYWEQMTWDGQDEPTYTPLLQSGSTYETRGMGLTYTAPPPPTISCDNTGQITREYWADVVGYNISDIPLSTPPTSTSELTSFQGPSNQADNYGARISGFVCPPTSGNYIFWIASDDKSELWLSTDDDPANKVMIASVTVWTNPDEWTKYSTQQSAPISLAAGQRYYIEALHKEIEGADHITVGWTLPDGTLERPIPGNRLLPFTSSTSEQRTTWNSYDMTISSNPAEQGVILSDLEIKAVIEFYQSTDDFGVTKDSLFAAHDPDNHPNAAAHATNWWKVSAGSTNYPYAALSTVPRGSDGGETNAPAPLGVIDLQLHPPIDDKLAVAAFIVPKAGTYEISNLGARRVSNAPSTGGTIRFQVFDQNKVKTADIVASNDQLWATSSSIIVLENVAANDRIYFATARDGSYAYDFTEVTWTVTFVPDASGSSARIASPLENEVITAVSEEESRAVYPNPVENVMHVKGLPGNETLVKIYNTRGMLMMRQHISGDQSHTTLELGNYTPGIYFIVLQNGRDMRRYKFIKK